MPNRIMHNLHNGIGLLIVDVIYSRFSSLQTINTLSPDPFQRPLELLLAQWSCQVPLAESASDPPDLQTANGKGDQTKLDVSPVEVLHYARC